MRRSGASLADGLRPPVPTCGWTRHRRYFSLGSMTKVDALEGGENPKELLAQIA